MQSEAFSLTMNNNLFNIQDRSKHLISAEMIVESDCQIDTVGSKADFQIGLKLSSV